MYRALIERDPANAEAFYNLGVALKQLDEFADAESHLRKACELDPALPEAPFTLGVVLWQTGRPSDALAEFRAAIARKPDYGQAHYMLGTILKQQGRWARCDRGISKRGQGRSDLGGSAFEPGAGARAGGPARSGGS